MFVSCLLELRPSGVSGAVYKPTLQSSNSTEASEPAIVHAPPPRNYRDNRTRQALFLEIRMPASPPLPASHKCFMWR